VQIRRGSGPADDEVGRSLVAAYFAEGPPPVPPHVEAYLDAFPAQLDRYLLAYDGPEAVGFVGLRWMAAGVGEVKRVYVVPSHRRRGLARSLMAAVVEEARHRGYTTLRLDTLASRTAAVALYESLGWHPIPPWDHSGEAMVAYEISV
jgi:putative acetyltransferase